MMAARYLRETDRDYQAECSALVQQIARMSRTEEAPEDESDNGTVINAMIGRARRIIERATQ